MAVIFSTRVHPQGDHCDVCDKKVEGHQSAFVTLDGWLFCSRECYDTDTKAVTVAARALGKAVA